MLVKGAPLYCQSLIWTSAVSSIISLRTNCCEIRYKILWTFGTMICCPFCHCLSVLTHSGQVTHICQWTNHYWFRKCLVTWLTPSHYLNQCWNTINCTLGNKLQWNLNRNLLIFIQKIASEKAVWKMAAILSLPQCVNCLSPELAGGLAHLIRLLYQQPDGPWAGYVPDSGVISCIYSTRQLLNGTSIVNHWQNCYLGQKISLEWCHNEHDSISNHHPHDCLLNRLSRHRSKKTSKLHVTCLCAGNSPGTGEFPAQRASNKENVSIWWRHHDIE